MSRRITFTPLTPKYLTEDIAKDAVNMVLEATLLSPRMHEILRRHMCHIVVLVPLIEVTKEGPTALWDYRHAEPVCLYETSVGTRENWPSEFDKIARSKALQLWRGQNTDGNTDVMPHLLFPGDTPKWGGVKRHGIVVACSGVQPYFDQMISGWVADALKAFARHHYENSEEKLEGRSFLS